MTEIPRILLDRDPRNKAHVRAANNLLMQLASIETTEHYKNELKKDAIITPENTAIVEKPSDDAITIANFDAVAPIWRTNRENCFKTLLGFLNQAIRLIEEREGRS